MSSNTVTRGMLMGDVVNKYPAAAQVMLEYGLHCVGCFANQFDTVEVGCKVHGMLDEEIDELLLRVNEAVSTEAQNTES
jgi:hybrid cluster-associated redox disulfide protein